MACYSLEHYLIKYLIQLLESATFVFSALILLVGKKSVT